MSTLINDVYQVTLTRQNHPLSNIMHGGLIDYSIHFMAFIRRLYLDGVRVFLCGKNSERPGSPRLK